MSRRPTLDELRAQLLFELDDEWVTASELHQRFGLGGHLWYRTALSLERFANELAELKTPGSRVRRFRRAR